jgi:class 3 adenylate cyclase
VTAVAPSGVVTFLFTDVEGSTRRWEADADAMQEALAAHDEVLRSAIEAHGGWLFKHTGDGVCAAFTLPRSTVDAAVAAQRELQLLVRMGLATGGAELRESDYFGTVLNRAARVMAAGHGGQILIADSTAGLLSGVDLVDLGPQRLRDVSVPVGVFQVRAQGLATEFPPLRALDTSPGNLRPQTTSLIGREAEAAELQDAVKSHRLVTLTGWAGSARLASRPRSPRAWPMSSQTGSGFSTGPLSQIRPQYQTRWPQCWASPSSPARPSASRSPLRWRAESGCWCSTTASTFWTPPPIWSKPSSELGDHAGSSYQSRRFGGADEQLWLVPSLDLEAGTDCSRDPVRRTRPQCGAAIFVG